VDVATRFRRSRIPDDPHCACTAKGFRFQFGAMRFRFRFQFQFSDRMIPMKNLLTPGFLAIAFLAVFGVTPGRAQVWQNSYVSMSGADTNNCLLATPCRTFAGAVAHTANRGVISCLQPGFTDEGFTVSFPLSVNCEGGNLKVLVVNQGGVAIIHGLNMTGDPSWAYPVNIRGSGTVVLDGLKFGGSTDYTFAGAVGGILVTPSGPLNLTIANSTIGATGREATGAGVLVRPDSGGSARVALERSVVSGNVFGVAFDGSNSTAGINAIIKDSMISGNSQDGIVATTTAGHAPIGVFVSGSASSNNAYGIRSIGANVTVRVENTKVTGNNTGLAASGGGAVLSLGNNAIQANGVKGAFTGSLALE
jgi:hypothetical protein